MASRGESKKRPRDSPAMKDRFWYLMHQCSSQEVLVTATNTQGDKVTGKLHTIVKGGIKLRDCSEASQEVTTLEGFKSLEFTLEDTADKTQRFKSDSEIVKARAPGRRELQKYTPDTPITHILGENSSASKFDQFETNMQLFGVQATFDEGLYTTPLVRPEDLTPEQVKHTESVIKAIERNERKDDAGGEMEEEEKFAAVKGTGRFKPLEKQRVATPVEEHAAEKAGDSKEYRKLRGDLMQCKRLDHDMAFIEALQLEVAPFHNDVVAGDLEKFKRQKQQEQGGSLKQELHEFKQEFERRSSILELSKAITPLESQQELDDYCPASLLDLYLDSLTEIEHTSPHWPEPAVTSPFSAPLRQPESLSLNPDAPEFEFPLLAS